MMFASMHKVVELCEKKLIKFFIVTLKTTTLVLQGRGSSSNFWMEHVLVPQGAELSDSDLVPYIAEREYDGGPFETFPQRGELSQFQLHEEGPGGTIGWTPPSSPDEEALLNAEMQLWLFSGLLHDFLGDAFSTNAFLQRKKLGSEEPFSPEHWQATVVTDCLG